jgi:hypothetical protein
LDCQRLHRIITHENAPAIGNPKRVAIAVLGANQQTLTDERGAYQFLRLAPAPTL